MRIINGKYSGEIWVQDNSLDMVRRSRKVFGVVDALLYGWVSIGDLNLVFVEEYDKPEKDYHFPLQVGNSWQQHLQLYSHGFYSQGVLGSDRFDQNSVLDINYTCSSYSAINGLPSLEIIEEVSPNVGTQKLYYAPQVGWFSRLVMSGVSYGSSGIEIGRASCRERV